MSAQFIFSPQNFEAVARAAGLTKTVSFNRVMLEHYEELYKKSRLSWIDPRRITMLSTVIMYRQRLEDAMVREFIDDVNKQHNGPAITIND